MYTGTYQQADNSLQWRRHERQGVSNHLQLDSMLNSWCRQLNYKSSTLLALCEETDGFHSQRANKAESIWNVIMWNDETNRYHIRRNKKDIKSFHPVHVPVPNGNLSANLDNLTPRFCSGYQWFRITVCGLDDVIQSGWQCRCQNIPCVRQPEYSGRTRSIPFLMSPGHQHPLCWLCKIIGLFQLIEAEYKCVGSEI